MVRAAVAMLLAFGTFAPMGAAAEEVHGDSLPSVTPDDQGSVDIASTGTLEPSSESGSGYWMVDLNGEVYAFGGARHHGGTPRGGVPPLPRCGLIEERYGYCEVVTDIVADFTNDSYFVLTSYGFLYRLGTIGYWLHPREQDPWISLLVGPEGVLGISSLGCSEGTDLAPRFGDLCGQHLNAPIVGSAMTPSAQGYYLVAADGGVFAFGDARFHGSTGGMHLNEPVVDIVVTPSGRGYWLVASDGGVFSFGDAPFYGSMGNLRLNRPISGMVGSPTGAGYLMVAEDGGIFTFGDVPFHGSLGANPPPWPIVAVAAR